MIILLLTIVLSWSLLAWTYRRMLYRLWVEPILRCPVLIIESDDWGPGPVFHANRLARLVDMLVRHRDGQGRHPVMTLGVILGVPDTLAIRQAEARNYCRVELDDARFHLVLEAMRQGLDAGVFAIQLHGMEHYWPPALMTAAAGDPAVRRWLMSDRVPCTEDLPSPLQSRWVNGCTTPSSRIADAQIRAAAAEEIGVYKRIFGTAPRVVVPPTFVWTQVVEDTWLEGGVRVIMTPGRRYTRRDKDGKPADEDKLVYSGERAGEDGIYLVRDVYFEPALGHSSQQTLAAVKKRFRLGRSALLETHRFNFTADEKGFQQALGEVDRLLGEALRTVPDIRFMTSEELGEAYRNAGSCSDLFERDLVPKINVWLRRAGEISRLRKLAWLTGLVVPAALLALVTAYWTVDKGAGQAPARAQRVDG